MLSPEKLQVMYIMFDDVDFTKRTKVFVDLHNSNPPSSNILSQRIQIETSVSSKTQSLTRDNEHVAVEKIKFVKGY